MDISIMEFSEKKPSDNLRVHIWNVLYIIYFKEKNIQVRFVRKDKGSLILYS